ncbi:MAG: hypothetical protein WC890_02515 [Candidatus Margulisiibacteriota bacterium]
MTEKITVRLRLQRFLSPVNRPTKLARNLAPHLAKLARSGTDPINCAETYLFGHNRIDFSVLSQRGIKSISIPSSFATKDQRKIIKGMLIIMLSARELPQALLSSYIAEFLSIETIDRSTTNAPRLGVITPVKSAPPPPTTATPSLSPEPKASEKKPATKFRFSHLSPASKITFIITAGLTLGPLIILSFAWPSASLLVAGGVVAGLLCFSIYCYSSEKANFEGKGILYINENAFPSEQTRAAIRQVLIENKLGNGMDLSYYEDRSAGDSMPRITSSQEGTIKAILQRHLGLQTNIPIEVRIFECTDKKRSFVEFYYFTSQSITDSCCCSRTEKISLLKLKLN